MKLIKRIFREAIDDDIMGQGAQVAYFFFFAFFPLILVLFALTGFFGGTQAFSWIMAWLERAAPPAAVSMVRGAVRSITTRPQGGALSVGLLLAVWAATSGITGLGDALNRVYDVKEQRSWWKRQVMAFILLLASLVLLVVSATAIVAGPTLLGLLPLDSIWPVIRWPLALVLLVLLFATFFLYLPNREQRHALGYVLLGATVAAVAWLLATYLFRLYVAHFGTYGATYGAIGAVIVFMLWLYLTAMAILLGGEVAATLEESRDTDPADAPRNQDQAA